jgi:hypothetical protein
VPTSLLSDEGANLMTAQLHPGAGVRHHVSTGRGLTPTVRQQLARELGDALTVVVGYARLVGDHSFLNDTLRRDVGEIIAAAERSAALVHSLQAVRDADPDRDAP